MSSLLSSSSLDLKWRQRLSVTCDREVVFLGGDLGFEPLKFCGNETCSLQLRSLAVPHFIYVLSDIPVQPKLAVHVPNSQSPGQQRWSSTLQASDFPNTIQEWQHNCRISPVSHSSNSESYNHTTSTSSCRVSGSPVALFRWAFGEVVTDIHCVSEGFVITYLLDATI